MRAFIGKHIIRQAFLLGALFASAFNPGNAQTFIAPQFSINQVWPALGQVSGLTFTPAGDKMFVWDKAGIVYLGNWNNATKTYDRQTTPVLNISEETGNWGDYGLLGFALDPNYATNGYIYLMYVVDRHHLLYFGTGFYSTILDDYNKATIGRITRYTTSVNGSQETIANPATRFVLLGETKSTGIPILHDSHGVGSLMFAADGTLIASCGDGASYDGIDTGSHPGTHWIDGINDGIIRPAENVGAYRSQILNSLSGKILRLDPLTGNGVSSNPFYDGLQPRSAKSRVWALGLRNPFRIIIRPNTGSPNPAAADVGDIYVQDVGWNDWEKIVIIREGGVNCGWPIYEGFGFAPFYPNINLNPTKRIFNKDEPNPLFGTGGCTQQFFRFDDLLKLPTADDNRFLPNPCNPAVNLVYGNSNRFIHKRPTISYSHSNNPALTYVGIFNGNTADTALVGSPSSGITGTPFSGFAITAGCWFRGNKFGTKYNDTYFAGDFVGSWIKNYTLQTAEKFNAVEAFGTNVAQAISMMQSPKDSNIYLIDYNGNRVRRIISGGNQIPVAVMSSTVSYGPSPHSVTFSSAGSYDPESGPLTYSWNFGDGATSTAANPSHSFVSGGGAPASFTVRFKITDNQGDTAVVTKIISVNNTPPAITIVSPVNGSYYNTGGTDTTYQLTANVTDESPPAQLSYEWQTILRHNTHEHKEAVDTNKNASATVARVGCSGETYYYMFTLKVTDAFGLSTFDSVKVFPNCDTVLPAISLHPQPQSTCENASTTFTSASSSNPVPAVQWQRSIDNGNNWTNISGATNASLIIIPVASENGNLFRAVWSNGAGSVNSNSALLTVLPSPSPPTGIASQVFCSAATVADLSANGTLIKWYSSSSGGSPLSAATALVSGNHYFASQTVSGCESVNRFDVLVTINAASSVTLDGSGSSGPITSYAWSLVSGPNTPIINTPTAVSTTVTGLIQGTYVFQLAVDGGASTSQVSIKVNLPSSPPFADAGNNKTITLPVTSVLLDGNGSVGAINNYSWVRISGPNNPAIATPNLASTNVSGLILGTYVFQLTITDTNNVVSNNTVQITVNPAPTPASPVISSTSVQSAASNIVVNALTGVPAGALLVVSIAQADEVINSTGVVSSSPALTWTKRADAQAIFAGNAEIHTAIFPAGGNINITSSVTGGCCGISTVVYVITNYNSNFAGVSGAASYIWGGSPGAPPIAPSVTIATTQANSLLIAVTSDWTAQNGATRVYRDAATESHYHRINNAYTGYHYRKFTTSIGNYTEGLTTPSNMQPGTAIFEIKGTDGVPATPIAFAGNNQNINIATTPTGNGTQNFCNNSTVASLVATGTNIKWYATPSGGSALLSTEPLINGNHYYASQTVNGCESAQRLDVTANLTTPAAPTGNASQGLCEGATVAALAATGTGIKWYSAASGGTLLLPGEILINGTHYYASQTINGCESATRLDVAVTLTSTSAPTGPAIQVFCNSAMVANLAATGIAVQWYLTQSGGAALPSNTSLVNGNHYYATQTIGGCESALRLDVEVTITSTPPPIGSSAQTFCNAATVLDLVVTGSNIAWYSVAVGGIALLSSDALVNGNHYYASQTSGACESTTRLDVTVTINITTAPTGAANQNFCNSATVANLIATGTAIKWYALASGGSPLLSTDALISGNQYYASQTISGCESSSRLDVIVTINSTPITPAVAVADNCNGTSILSTEAGGSLLWSTTATTSSIIVGTPGMYSVTSTVGGCTSAAGWGLAAPKSTPAAPTITVTDNCDGTLILSTVAAGTLLWSTGASTSSIVVNTADTYTVTTTINGCTSAAGSRSVVPNPVLAITATPTQPLCLGELGSVVLGASGGAGGYIFSGDPVNNLAAGTYNFTVTDANGCSKNISIIIGITIVTWTGAIDSDWHNAGNWSNNAVPTSTTHVIIPVTANECIISTDDAIAASVQSKTGASFKIENSRKITLSGKCGVLPPL